MSGVLFSVLNRRLDASRIGAVLDEILGAHLTRPACVGNNLAMREKSVPNCVIAR